MAAAFHAFGHGKICAIKPTGGRKRTRKLLRPWRWARWQRSDLHVGVSERRPRSHPQVAVNKLFAMLSQRTGGEMAAVNLRSRATMVCVTKNLQEDSKGSINTAGL